MPFVAISDILFLSDEFWGHSTLNSLRLLLSTCKGFRVELQEDKKKKITVSPVEHAMLVMIQRRPTANDGWIMSFSKAKYCFSLPAEAMIKLCMALPAHDECHLSEEDLARYRAGCSAYIRFIDAYRLASKAGLRAAMERRDRRDSKALESARESIQVFSRPLNRMRLNVRTACQELGERLANLQKDKKGGTKKRVAGESDLIKDVRVLKKLHDDIRRAAMYENWISSSLFRHSLIQIVGRSTRKVDIQRLEEDVAEYKSARRTLVARYRAHSVRCPGTMTLGCLAGLE